MNAVEKYTFSRKKFDKNGFNVDDGSFFLELLDEWAQNFSKKHPTCPANHLFANSSTMLLIENCLCLKDDETCGMDLIDGEVDLDTNMEIESYSKFATIYALGIGPNDEPAFLVIDENLPDDKLILKYIPDNDLDNYEIPVNIHAGFVKV